jgi:hypothetical protein
LENSLKTKVTNLFLPSVCSTASFRAEWFTSPFLEPLQNVTYGVFYMLLFGLGTMPLMSVVIYFNSFVTPSFRNKIQTFIPYVAVFIGCLLYFAV